MSTPDSPLPLLAAITLLGLSCGSPEGELPDSNASSPVPADPVPAANLRADAPLDPGAYGVIAKELITMETRDQELNWLVVNGAPEAHEEGFAARKAKLYASNTSRAAEIFDEIGYPSSDLVGTDGEHAFWLVVQHSDQRPGFQVRVAKAMHPIVLAGGAGGDRLAMLVDRVRINTDRPQVFGSQVRYELETGRALPKALEDPRAVDARRAEVGLKPLWQYMNEMCELQFMMNEAYYQKLGVEVPSIYPAGYADW